MNKIKAFLIIVALLTTSLTFGQMKKVALGLGISPTVNWLKSKSDNLESAGSRIGFNYGLITDFNFGENYAFSTGIFINNGGGKLNLTNTNDSIDHSVESSIKIQSIRIPITLRMMTKEIGYFRYYGKFGFNLDYVINATSDVRVDGGPEERDINIKSEIFPLNLSLSLGIGFLYNWSGTTNFIVGVTFNNGFIDVLQPDTGDDPNLNATANQFALNLGVLF